MADLRDPTRGAGGRALRSTRLPTRLPSASALLPFVLVGACGLGLLVADRLAAAGTTPPEILSWFGANTELGLSLAASHVSFYAALALLAGVIILGIFAPLRCRLPINACATRRMLESLRTGRGQGRRPSRRLMMAFGVLAVFLLSSARLMVRFEHATSDTDIAWAAAENGPGGVRIVDALVARRTERPWGDEVILAQVRAADGLGGVPRSLLLRMDSRRESPGQSKRDFDRADFLLRPGLQVRLGLRVAPWLAARNPGRADSAHAAGRRGIGAVARLVGPGWMVERVRGEAPRAHSFFRRTSRYRVDVRRTVVERFARVSNNIGLAAALAVGDRSHLSEETRTSLRSMGLSHLIAISGLHVGLVGGFAVLLARRLWAIAPGRLGYLPVRNRTRISSRRPRLDPFSGPIACGAAAAAGYAWLSGAAPAVLRAALLFLLLALARAVGRRFSAAAGLAWVALGLIAIEPTVFFDVGAQLSFAACAGLVFAGWGVSSQQRRTTGFGEQMADSLRLSAAASFATAPFIAGMGGVLSVWGPAINLLAIPWTAFVVLPASFAAALMAVGLDGTEADAVIEFLLLPAVFSEAAAGSVAPRLPFIDLPIGLGPNAVGLIVILGLWQLRRKRPGVAYLIWVVLAGSTLTAGLVSPRGVESPYVPRVVFLDVGQGDAALIQGNRANVLIDTGGGVPGRPNGASVVRSLRALGVSELDLLVITHGDYDHRGGATAVLRSFKVNELWLPSGAQADPPLRDLAEEARALGARVAWVDGAPAPVGIGDLSIEVLWPAPTEALVRMDTAEVSSVAATKSRRAYSKRRNRNDGSLVLRIRLDGLTYLFTADVGREVEHALLRQVGGDRILESDVLKVGHHGSALSSSLEFLAAVSPQLAIVTAPCRATRGLPDEEVLGRVVSKGAKLAWTGRDGAIFVSRGKGESAAWLGWGHPRPCAGPRLTADEARRSFLDEGALSFPGIFRPTKGASECFLLGVSVLKIHPVQCANAGEGGLDREGRVLRNLVGGFEGARHQLLWRDDFIQESNSERLFSVDRLRGIKEMGGMNGSNLSGERDRRLSRGIEPERNFFEGEGRMRDRVANLARQHQVEATRASMAIHGSNQGHAQPGLHESGVTDRTYSFKVDRVDLFSPG